MFCFRAKLRQFPPTSDSSQSTTKAWTPDYFGSLPYGVTKYRWRVVSEDNPDDPFIGNDLGKRVRDKSRTFFNRTVPRMYSKGTSMVRASLKWNSEMHCSFAIVEHHPISPLIAMVVELNSPYLMAFSANKKD